MRSISFSLMSLLMTGAVIGNAFYQKKQFYPSVVYITRSNASMAVIYLQFFMVVLMLGKLLRKIFLGTLRAAEFDHLMERFWYALTETCLAFTVFRDDFNPRFVALFTVLLFLKSFHWLAAERVDFMERSPVIGWLFHVRVVSLLSMLGILDYTLIMHAYNSSVNEGPTVQLVFGFEYAVLITMVANYVIIYSLHAAEMRADNPWENKAVFLLYTELVVGFIKVVLYVIFVVIMAKVYALPMFVFRPMFYSMRNFKRALNDVIMSRRAIRNMNTLYPDATEEELALSDNICIICREDMVSNSKKLPCGHIFHRTCLRSWFQRQQTCPTCRLNILRTPNIVAPVIPTPEPAPIVNQPANQNNALPNNTTTTHESTTNFNQTTDEQANNPNVNAMNTSAFLMPSPFPFLAPYTIPPPPMPPSLDTLTEDELKALEGNERKHIEERLKLLRNIQLLLDASSILMSQYQAVSAKILLTANANTKSQSTQVEIPIDCTHFLISKDIDVTEQINSNGKTVDRAIPCSSKYIENEVSIEDIGTEEDTYTPTKNSLEVSGTSKDVIDANKSEVIKRRLAKFEPKKLSE